ncbi:MAG: dihydrodipicolinate synthase family protein [Bacteroidota bacterium]|nr:dihydrodipicolinate synthase family protein [Bacteroidota bacterium]
MEKKFVPVMLTPFKENGEIDFDGLTRLTELYLQAGVKGLFANCQSSEMYELSEEEKLLIVKHVMKISAGEVPVVAVGNFGKTMAEQADFMGKIYDIGVNAVIIVTSLIAEENESDAIFEERVLELFELTGKIPVGFYECPKPYKRVLTADQLLKFVATGKVIYHKDTCLDIAQVREKLNVTAKYENFGLYDAYAVNSIASLRAGAAGLSCIQGNFFPELMVWLCDHYDDRQEEAKEVQLFLDEHMGVAHHAYPIVAKYFLQKSGLNISKVTRTKTDVFSSEVKDNVNQFLDQYNQLKNNLGI